MSKFTILDGAAFDKLLTSIAKTTKTLEADIQTGLVSATAQAIDHGNTTPVNRLFAVIGKGTRKAAIVGWLAQFAPVTVDSADKGQPFKLDKDARTTYANNRDDHLTNAAASLWVEFKPEPDALAEFDAAKAVAMLLAKIDKLAKAGTTITHGEVVAKLRAMTAEASTDVAPL